MAISWPGILRKVGACCLGSGRSSQSGRASEGPPRQGPSAESSQRPRAWRRAAQLVRPLLLTVLAGLAFACLLRFHHARFEDSMVRSFQRQQMDAARNLAASIEERVENVRRNLGLLAGHPDVCRLAPGMGEVLSAGLQLEKGVLDDLAVLDASGKELWRASGAAAEGSGPASRPAGAGASGAESGGRLVLSAPIEMEGRPVGSLQARVNVYGAAVYCRSRAVGAYTSLYWILSDAGEVLYTNAGPQPRRVLYVLGRADAVREPRGGVDLLPYVADRCVVRGVSELAEVAREGQGVDELAAFVPFRLEGRRFGLLAASPRAEVSVPIASHERVTYALIGALALLYFATGYTATRSERAHAQVEEQRRMAAEQASRAKGNFLAHMSHELRTPMNGVISMTELALATEDDGERKRYIGVVRQCAHSLLDVINDILDLSKIEAGRLELCRTPLNVQECVANSLASLAALAGDKGLALHWDIAPDVPPVVLGDPGRLRQVLNNLVGNAIKFTRAGEVVVRVSPQTFGRDGVCLRFDVRDTGSGMSPQDQESVFAAYRQGAGADAYRPDGTGLGLAIARQIVELMGGRISVSSQIGRGTVFTFTARFGAAREADLAGLGEALPSLEGVRVLVVSGVEANRERFGGLLASWGALAEGAEGPEAGLAALRDAQARGAPYALVLCDGSGPSMDAFSFAEAASAVPGHEAVALLVLYPAGLRGDAAACLHAGIDAYLGIPVEDDQLHATLRMAMRHATAEKSRSLITKHSSPARPLEVLLVDDNPVNRQAGSLLLGHWGHRVRTVESGEEALAALEAGRFDLVLMDLEMPGMNGLEVTAEIRRREAGTGRRTPIVAMTAHAMDRDLERCLKAGMDQYLSKPMRPEQIRRVLEEVSAGRVGPAAQPAPTVPAADGPQRGAAWDRAEALRLADGDPRTAAVLVRTFLEDLGQTLPAAEAAAASRDGRTLAGLAHRWKGSLGLLGARRAQSCAAQLEDACRLGEPQRLLGCFQRLRRELLELQREISLFAQENVPCESS